MVFNLGTSGGRDDIAAVPTVLLPPPAGAGAGAEVVGDASGDPAADPVSEVDRRAIISRRLMRRPFLRRWPSSRAGLEDQRRFDSSVELLHWRETSSLKVSSSGGRWGARSDTRSASRTGCEARGAARRLASAAETPPVATASPSCLVGSSGGGGLLNRRLSFPLNHDLILDSDFGDDSDFIDVGLLVCGSASAASETTWSCEGPRLGSVVLSAVDSGCATGTVAFSEPRSNCPSAPLVTGVVVSCLRSSFSAVFPKDFLLVREKIFLLPNRERLRPSDPFAFS